MICKKDHDLFLFFQSTYILDICKNCLTEAILTNIQNICFCQVSNTIFLHNLWKSNCHYSEFCRCIECQYKEGCLYFNDLIQVIFQFILLN